MAKSFTCEKDCIVRINNRHTIHIAEHGTVMVPQVDEIDSLLGVSRDGDIISDSVIENEGLVTLQFEDVADEVTYRAEGHLKTARRQLEEGDILDGMDSLVLAARLGSNEAMRLLMHNYFKFILELKNQ